MINGRTVFSEVGGAETFERIAAAFYRRVEDDPVLRPLYPPHVGCARRHLALFLAQFFGGPADYNAQRGSPRLRMRHAPFHIGQRERDSWLACMAGALADTEVPEPARSLMAGYFVSAADFLMNTPPEAEAPVAASLTDHFGAVPVERVFAALKQGDAAQAGALLRAREVQAVVEADATLARDVAAACLRTRGAAPLAIEILSSRADLVEVRGVNGMRLLHEAAGAWQPSMVERLLALGADPGARDVGLHTPLYHAANHVLRPGDVDAEGREVIRLLIAAGSDVNDAAGVQRATPLHMAARRGTVAAAEALLAAGAQIEARDVNGRTPLHRAVRGRHAGLVRALLAAGADAGTVDNGGVSALDAARAGEIRDALQAAVVG